MRVERMESRLLLFAGQLDVSFGDLGTAARSLDAPILASPSAVVVQPDGKLLVAGTNTGTGSGAPLLARYQTDGRLDSTFGHAGRVDLSLDTTFYHGALTFGDVKAAVVQASGRILVVTDIGDDVSVLALRPDGTPDTLFGRGGITVVSNNNTGNSASINSATLLPDQSLLIGASLDRYDNLDNRSQLTSAKAAYIHLLPDGAVDPAYADAFRTLKLKHFDNASVERLTSLPDGSSIAVGRVGDDVLLFKITADGYATRAFGRDGWTATDFGKAAEVARAVVVLADGSIVLAGDSAGDVVLARYSADGQPLATFGVAGQVRLDLGATETAADLVVAPDGRLIVAGASGAASGHAGVAIAAAFRQRGRLDRGYGASGVARITFAPKPPNSNPASAEADPNAASAAVFVGGSLLIVGSAPGTAECPPATRFGLALLKSDGSSDRSFAVDGITTTEFRRQVQFHGVQIARQMDGKIVALCTYRQAEEVAVILRFTPDGLPDPTFGSGGVLRVRLGSAFGYSGPEGLRIDARGGLIGLITSFDSPRPPQSVIVRVTSAGTLDTDFADHGLLDPGMGATGIALQGNRIIIAGRDGGAFVLRRFDAAGQRDKTFGAGVGAGGEAKFLFTRQPDSGAFLSSVQIAPDGNLVAVGYLAYGMGSLHPTSDFAVARFTADGKTDVSFGAAGAVTFPAPPGENNYSGAHSATFTPYGQIVLVGEGSPDPHGPTQPILARLRRDGALDPTFGYGGLSFPALDGTDSSRFVAVAIRADGSVIAGGSETFDSGEVGAATIRLTSAGAMDTAYGDHAIGHGAAGFDQFLEDALIAPDGSVTVATFAFAGDLTATLTRFLGEQSPAITARIDRGVLRVTGTPGPDHILLRRHSDGIEVVSLPGRFNPALFSRVEIRAFAGDDRIDASAMNIPATIDGGDGDDLALGGWAADSISGGNGRDTLFGGRGDDTLSGGNGNDYLNPGPGADHVFGDAGNDQIYALDSQPDTIDGGAGFDRAKTEPDDLLSAIEGTFA
ncbi:MAG: hypothetical protein JWN40_3620 [Phycisphaerales bacterium]|nr:hypothetical protein [Phycisphaerales bacterium]